MEELILTIPKKDGVEVTCRLEVEPPKYQKEYLGGFRNVKNGLIYLNYFAQTDQIQRDHKVKEERDVPFLAGF